MQSRNSNIVYQGNDDLNDSNSNNNNNNNEKLNMLYILRELYKEICKRYHNSRFIGKERKNAHTTTQRKTTKNG